MLRRVIPLLVAAALLAAACGDTGPLDVHRAAAADPPPRDAVLVDAGWPEAAAWIRREAEEGRPVVMNILASWCIPCRRELPLLLDAAEDNPDIAFLGINHLDQRDNAEQFVEEMGITFPTLYDPVGDVAAGVEARGMPTTVFFDRNGVLVSRVTGELTARSLEEHLDRIR